MKKFIKYIVLLSLALVLISCGKRNDLTEADFPEIGNGLTVSQLKEQVGSPHRKFTGSGDMLAIETEVFNSDVLYDHDPNWVLTDLPDAYYVYQLSDGQQAMVAAVLDDNVVKITTSPIELEVE